MVHRRHADCASHRSRVDSEVNVGPRCSNDGGWQRMTMQFELSRRGFLRAGLSVVGVGLLAACAPAAPAAKPAETKPAETKPAEAAKPADAPKPAAPAAATT